MEHYFWSVHLDPWVGWTVILWQKRANLWPREVERYERLTVRERDQVLDDGSTALLLRLAAEAVSVP